MAKVKNAAPVEAKKQRGKTRSLFISDDDWDLLTRQADAARRNRSAQVMYLVQKEASGVDPHP